jgi:prepilin-type N-terminal cleavage/methylation domain-containing protein
MRQTSSDQRGFSLIEVVIALTILSTVVLLMAVPAGRFMSTINKSQRKIQAAATADAQVALVRSYPVYDSLLVKFDSTRSNTPFTGWTRTTSVVRTGQGTTGDITRVTVTVTGPGLATPVKRFATVAAP